MRTRLPMAVAVMLSALCPGISQDLAAIGKENGVNLSGGMSLNQIFYQVEGVESRRDPYSYFLTGNLNLSVYGWSVPVSLAISNQNRSFQQPFNQYGLHPTYKWATAHLGYASMSFSPYTLSGHIFRGAGVELTPGKFSVSAMYGQLRKAIEADTLRNSVPSFRRNGYGFKTGYRDGNDIAELSFFYAKDALNPLVLNPSDTSLLPEENMVIGLSLGKQLTERLVIRTEYASSAITRDTRDATRESDHLFAALGFDTKLSTSFYQAWKGGIDYQAERLTLGLGYERIDPGYRTHGAYYFNNDLENYTLNAAAILLDSRLNLSGSMGVQHDNLDNTKISTMNRLVAALNAAFAASERISLNAAYSNFQSFTNIRSQFVNLNQLTPYDNLDTLQFTQIAQNISLGANVILNNDRQKQQTLFFNATVQDAAERQSQVAENSGSRFYNFNASYSVNYLPRNVMLTFSYNLNRNRSPVLEMLTHGPNVSFNKSLMDRRLRLSWMVGYNTTAADGSTVNRIVNARGGASYAIRKQHNFTMGVTAVNRQSNAESGTQAFTEFTATLTYSYSFSK